MKNKLRGIKQTFPTAKIDISNDIKIEFFFECEDGQEQLIIKTPDRSEPYKQALARLKQSGLTGVWRSKENG